MAKAAGAPADPCGLVCGKRRKGSACRVLSKQVSGNWGGAHSGCQRTGKWADQRISRAQNHRTAGQQSADHRTSGLTDQRADQQISGSERQQISGQRGSVLSISRPALQRISRPVNRSADQRVSQGASGSTDQRINGLTDGLTYQAPSPFRALHRAGSEQCRKAAAGGHIVNFRLSVPWFLRSCVAVTKTTAFLCL